MKWMAKHCYLTLRGHLLRPLFPEAASEVNLDSVRTIVVLRFDRIGDMVHATPLLEALKGELPAASVTVLASEENAPILLGNPNVETVRIMPSRGRGKLLAALRDQRFDLLVDPYWEYDLEWARVAGKIGARYSVGFDVRGRGLFYNVRVPGPARGLSASEVMLALCRQGLGRPFRSREPKIYLQDGEAEAGREALLEAGVDSSKGIVLLHPGGHYPAQRWAPEGFAEVAEALVRTGKWATAVVGGPRDEPILHRATRHVPTVRVIVTRSLRDLIGLLPHARLLICNNSGPLHVAYALNIPTLSTLGPTDRALWAPKGRLHHIIEKEPLTALGAGEVIDRALAFLDQIK